MDKHYKDYIQIGLNIMRYRKEQGLTQDQLFLAAHPRDKRPSDPGHPRPRVR